MFLSMFWGIYMDNKGLVFITTSRVSPFIIFTDKQASAQRMCY